jgi:glucose/arabinose dehydrogenase
MSFDAETGRLFVGDVGQNAWEEVNVVEKGGNYGWNVREATHCFQAGECPSETPDGEALIDPILEYPHSGADVTGISVSGGHVYRGGSIPALQGHYVFGDLRPDGRLFVGVSPSDGEAWSLESVPIADADAPKLPNLIAIGRGHTGELYLTTRGQESGAVYRVVGEEAAQTTTVAVDDTPPATDDGGDPGQQAPATPADGPGLGVASALAGLAASLGLARWFRG